MIDELINKILKTHYNLDVQKLNGKDITFDKKRDKIRNKFNNSNIFIAPLKQSIEQQSMQQILNIGRATIATNEEFSISIDENQEDGNMKNSVRMNTPVNNNSSNNTETQVFILE